MKGRRGYYSLDMESNGDEYRIEIEAPSPADWYAIAFRSWSDPDNGKITQQGELLEIKSKLRVPGGLIIFLHRSWSVLRHSTRC